MGKCTEDRKKPRLKGKKPKFLCKRCGMKARKRDQLCKPRKVA
ncbi:MAG: hypothetical protein ACYS0K_07095 [Planctomycetota bacterium]